MKNINININLILITLLITVTACGPSAEERNNIVKISCNIMESTRGLDSNSVLLKEINNTRQKIGEDPYLDDSDAIREALEIRLCVELVSNDPLYESKKTRRIYQIEEEIRIQKEKDRQELLQLIKLSNLKKEQERIAREKKEEEERIAREKKEEEERIAREKKEEEERIAIELAKNKFTDAIINRVESNPIRVQLTKWGSTGHSMAGGKIPYHAISYQCYGASGLMGFALVVKYKNNWGEIRHNIYKGGHSSKCGESERLRPGESIYPNRAGLDVLAKAHRDLYKDSNPGNSHQVTTWRKYVESVYVEWDGGVGPDSMINPSMFGLPRGTRIDVSKTKNKFYLYQSD